jgi:hypothetical protein
MHQLVTATKSNHEQIVGRQACDKELKYGIVQ